MGAHILSSGWQWVKLLTDTLQQRSFSGQVGAGRGLRWCKAALTETYTYGCTNTLKILGNIQINIINCLNYDEEITVIFNGCLICVKFV